MDKERVLSGLVKSGMGSTAAGKLIWDLTGDSNKNTQKLIDTIDANPRISEANKEAFVVAIGKKYQSDNSVLEKLEADLKSDPALAQKLEKSIATDPNGFMNTVLPAYKGGNMNQLLQASAKPAPAAPATEPIAIAVSAKSATPASTPKQTQGRMPPKAEPAAVIAAAAPAPSKKDEPVVNGGDRNAIFKSAFENFADAKDNEISSRVNSDLVKGIANGMAEDAVTKYGVEPAIAEGFSRRINGDPKLVEKIEENLKQNPGFVRQLALASKDKSEIPDAAKGEAKRLMTSVMENPEKLADDREVKSLESKMKMASGMSGIGGFLDKFLPAGMGGQIMGWFSQIFEKIKHFFSGFSGKPVLSMANGSGLFPTVMVHTRNFKENQDNAAAFSKYQPTDMTAYPDKVNGSPFHTEPVLDSKGNQVMRDGKPVSRELPNTITVKDLDGKEHKVIPSVGALQAKQEKGAYDANGAWKPGNVLVPVVTGIDKSGNSSKLDRITMTPDQFDAYKKDMEARSGRTYPFAAYTEADARGEPTTPVTRVAANNGSVIGTQDVSPVGAVATPVPNPSVVGRPLDASNDPDSDRKPKFKAY